MDFTQFITQIQNTHSVLQDQSVKVFDLNILGTLSQELKGVNILPMTIICKYHNINHIDCPFWRRGWPALLLGSVQGAKVGRLKVNTIIFAMNFISRHLFTVFRLRSKSISFAKEDKSDFQYWIWQSLLKPQRHSVISL